MAGLVQAKWTDQILDETFRNLKANRPDLSPERLTRTRELMGDAIRDARVEGYEHRISELELPEPDDRHVLVAAIYSGADLIVTKNLSDFSQVSSGVRDRPPSIRMRFFLIWPRRIAVCSSASSRTLLR